VGTVIDSSVLIAAERGEVDLEPLLKSAGDDLVVIAAITASELLHGIHRLKGVKRARVETLVEGLLARVPVVAFDLAVARVHAILSADLRARALAVGAHDLIIAATAVMLGFTVATRDARSFPRIKGLDVLYW
jgi:tRNA(fMet)-specific endonuclease VapC